MGNKNDAFKFDPVTLPTDEKVDKKFTTSIQNLFAAVGNPKRLKKVKVANEAVSAVIDEAFKEEEEAAKDKLKTDVKQFVKDYQTFQKETANAFNEFKAKVKKEKEAFTGRAVGLLDTVQNLEEYRKTNLKIFLGGVSTTETSSDGSGDSEDISDDNPNDSKE
jgi:hypothetical protein